ncbi:phosphatidylglycerophosphatase C [Geodermatophilus normandii]|uniref:Phosphatidylglycerophosphatase C n=1 Tax=Geodermatophilus normandii TaxID=1137989 RepID=A0A317QKV7_9ACTN|nr:HAD-IB family phosphatase [Geodermatophilus normandii]PWW22815.1 phosphatidylglycerophosphatase C [Geodermatophilus normandii]
MSSPGRREVVVFDLDGTLVAGDSFGAFLRHLLTRRRPRLAAALLTAPVWLPALAVGRLRVPAERWLVWLAAVGLDADRFAAAARSFAAQHAGAAGGRAAPAVLARLREHVGRGDRVVVATACATPLAAEVCRVIGLEDVEVVASDLRRTRWGPPAPTVPARGEGKVQALRAAGVPLPLDHAYSDSASDLPLLRAARVPHLVDPSPRELRRLRAALGPDVEVLRRAQGRG